MPLYRLTRAFHNHTAILSDVLLRSFKEISSYQLSNTASGINTMMRCHLTQLLSVIVVLGYFDFITKSWAQEDSSRPVVFLHPTSFNVSIIHGNESMKLMCLAFGGDNLTYSWERENSLLPKTATGQNTHLLTLSRLRPSDNGNYQCRVSNTHGSMFSNYATVNVTASMQAMVEPHNLTVEVSTSVILSCMVDGFQMDNVSYVWDVSETAGGMEASQLHNSTSSRLPLNNVTASKAYRCIATNSSGKIAISPFSYISVAVHPPKITAHPTSKNVYLYTSNRSINISFTCAAAGNSTHFQWERLQEALPVNSKGEATNTLTLYDVQPEDRGFYRCSVSNSSGTTHSNYAALNVTVHPPNVTAAYLNQSAYTVGDRAVLVCNGEGYGKLYFEWERQNGNISLSALVDINSGTLVIPDLSSVDTGNYRCIVHDEFNGTVYSEYVRLNLSVGPVISTASESMFVRQNTNASLSCGNTVGRLINATFVWSRTDGEPLSSRTYGNNSSVLTIVGVSEEDEAEYSCTATTERETLTRAIILTVYDIPRISQLESQYVVDLSGTLFIDCTAQNDPDSPHPLELTWYKGDNQLMDGLNERYQITSVPERNNIAIVTLGISRVQKDDAGQYSCRVNPGDISTETTVVVNYKPEILQFQILPSNTVAFGEAVQLLCRVDGKPLPTVTIYRNNEMKFSTRNTVVEYPIQQVSANHNGTVFSCGAQNRVGTASQQHITLTVTGIPDASSTTTISPSSSSTSESILPSVTATSVFAAPTSRPVATPTNVEQTSRELDSLQIQWTASEENVLFHIRLFCVTPCTDGEEVRNFETRDTSLTVHGLKPGHTYVVQIAAVTDNDVRSEYSDSLQVSTASASDSNSVMFQLRLVSETPCNEWKAILDMVTAAVVSDIAEHCGCPLSSANVFDDSISCDNAGHVIYRAEVTTSTQLDVEEIRSVLDEWFTQTSSLTVDGSVLQVDRSCPLILTSFDDPICRTTTSPDSSNSNQNVVPLLAGIIGGIIFGAVIVTILAVVLMVKCRGKTDQIRPRGNTPVNSSLTRSEERAQAGRKAQTNEEATYSEVFNNLPPLCELQSCPAYQASVYLDHDYADIDEKNFTAVTSAHAGQVHPSHSHNELELSSSSSSSVRCNGNDYCEPLTLNQRTENRASQLVQAKVASNSCSDYIEPVSHNNASNSEPNHQDTMNSQPLQQQQHQQLLPTEYLEPVSLKDSQDHFQKYDHLSSKNKMTNIYTECN